MKGRTKIKKTKPKSQNEQLFRVKDLKPYNYTNSFIAYFYNNRFSVFYIYGTLFFGPVEYTTLGNRSAPVACLCKTSTSTLAGTHLYHG